MAQNRGEIFTEHATFGRRYRYDMTSEPTWPELLTALTQSQDLSLAQAEWAMRQIMSGEVTEAQLGGLLVGLKAKGESVDEILGFRDAVLANATPVSLDRNAVDIVGTGGDRHGTVNVSTMAAIVVAATGVPVIKHGNRAATSQSGSSDVLGALGVNLDLEPERIQAIYEQLSIAFIFAARFHPGFLYAAGVRQQLGIPTVFNFLGPLCNPAEPKASAVGVADPRRAELVAQVFALRNATALVFRGDDGLDELTTTGHSRIWEVTQGEVKQHDIDARELGLPRVELRDLIGGDALHNAGIARQVLSGETGPVRDIVLLNAAGGLVAYELEANPSSSSESLLARLEKKINVAAEAIDSGAAVQLLERWARATQVTS